MRAIRATHYGHMTKTPTFGVILEGETVDTLESIRYQRMPGSLILIDIFEVPEDASVDQATLIGGQRRREHEKVEQDQATLFFWTVDEMLPKIPSGKSAAYPGPIPLTTEEVAEVMEQVALHPAYSDHKLGVPTKDGGMVVLDKGKVEYGVD